MEGFLCRLKSIAKAKSINMGFNLSGNYFFCEVGDVVRVRDRAVVFKYILREGRFFV